MLRSWHFEIGQADSWVSGIERRAPPSLLETLDSGSMISPQVYLALTEGCQEFA